MAEQTEPEATKKPKSKVLSLLVFGVFGIVMAALGFAVPLLVPGIRPSSEESSDVQHVSIESPAFISFGEIVVNLNSDRLNRYLRIAITLQVNEGEQDFVTTTMDKKRTILRSWLISFLSDASMEDIRGAVGQNRLRRQIQDNFNSTMFDDGYDRIHDILFEEFNVQ